MNYSVVLIKPRAKQLSIDTKVRDYLDQNNLKVTFEKPVNFTYDLMRQFAPHVNEEHLPELIAYLSEAETVGWLIEGEDALKKCLTMRDTIRNEYRTVQPYTYVHASDCNDAAVREKRVIFLD